MKLKFTLSLIVLAGLGLIGMESCKNEVDIFAPESDVTLIYGLLDASDKVHQIKINRVFQGTDGVDGLAQDPTVSEYENIEAKLVELSYDGFGNVDTTNIWPFEESTITNKDSGYFYYPDQKIYQLEENLDSNKNYMVMVDKLNGSPIVKSTTELLQVHGDIVIRPIGLQFPGAGLGLCDKDGPIEKITLELNTPVNAKVMDVYLDFSYQDEYPNNVMGDTITLSFYVGQGIVTSVGTEVGKTETIRMELNPTAFYEFIAARVPVVEPGDNIVQRIPVNAALDGPVDFRFISGGTELNTYIEVSSPSTSLLETKPDYTNIENGIGLWSTRSFDNKWAFLSSFSIDYLVNGEITAGRKFCHYTSNTDPNRCY
ncbi:MAG: hypothetical protein ACPGVC_09600 [Salibacteraceae bacterium]